MVPGFPPDGYPPWVKKTFDGDAPPEGLNRVKNLGKCPIFSVFMSNTQLLYIMHKGKRHDGG